MTGYGSPIVPKIVQFRVNRDLIDDFHNVVEVDGVQYAVRIVRAGLWDYVSMIVRSGLSR